MSESVHKKQLMHPATVNVFFIVPPMVHLLDISGPAHVFYEARAYDAPIDLHFLALNKNEEETSSAGISLARLEDYDSYELRENDLVFVPGLESHLIFDKNFEASNTDFYTWLKRQYENKAKICSVCTGAYLLAQSGILNGKECTTHWKYIDDFKNRFPKVTLHNDRLFVKDSTVYSSAGVSSGIDLALFLLEELFDPLFAIKIAKEIVVYLRRAEGDPQLSVFLQYRNHIENRVHQTQDYLAQNLEKRVKIEELANQVNMSPRNLTRMFRKTTGITIGQYIDKLRVERAIQLLADGQKVEIVSQNCGLQSSNQLRTLLKKYRSALPSNLS